MPQDWSGVYVGLEGGYGWGRQKSDSILPGDPFTATISNGAQLASLSPAISFPGVNIPSTIQRGWSLGGFFGAQKQWGNLVLGIEGDINGAGIKGSGTSSASFSSNGAVFVDAQGVPLGGNNNCTPCFILNHNLAIESKIDTIASLRGKAGYAPSPNWLIYETGGAALAHADNTIFATQTSVNLLTTFNSSLCGIDGVTCTFSPNSQSTISGGAILFGYAAGGGLDYKLPLDEGSALVFGAEYLHYGFPRQTITLIDNAGGSRSFRISQDADVVKARISYLFSIH